VRLTIRDMLISPSVKTSLIVLEILGLDSKYPTELVVPFLDKVMKCGALRGKKSTKGHLLLLNGLKCAVDLITISGGRLGRRTRYAQNSR